MLIVKLSRAESTRGTGPGGEGKGEDVEECILYTCRIIYSKINSLDAARAANFVSRLRPAEVRGVSTGPAENGEAKYRTAIASMMATVPVDTSTAVFTEPRQFFRRGVIDGCTKNCFPTGFRGDSFHSCFRACRVYGV